jgi:hypothetical protein
MHPSCKFYFVSFASEAEQARDRTAAMMHYSFMEEINEENRVISHKKQVIKQISNSYILFVRPYGVNCHRNQ